ncbi:MAG: hypothetical protein AAF798_17945 [Bacteroidota bacterium]
MIKLFSFFLVLFLTSTNLSFAQSAGENVSEEQKQEMKQNMEALAAELNLTEEQKTEFKAITQKYAAKMMEVRDSGSSKWKKYKAVQKIGKERNQEMKTLLTEEQYEVYLEKQKERQAKMKEKRNKKG